MFRPCLYISSLPARPPRVPMQQDLTFIMCMSVIRHNLSMRMAQSLRWIVERLKMRPRGAQLRCQVFSQPSRACKLRRNLFSRLLSAFPPPSPPCQYSSHKSQRHLSTSSHLPTTPWTPLVPSRRSAGDLVVLEKSSPRRRSCVKTATLASTPAESPGAFIFYLSPFTP